MRHCENAGKRKMNAVLSRLQDPTFTGKLHLWLMGLWVLLIAPTMLWWSESVLWVLLISIYANIVGHLSAWQATQAEKNGD